MEKIMTISKNEYRHLQGIERKYEALRRLFSVAEAGKLESPPIHDASIVLKTMKDSGRYNTAFLKSLAKGMRESRTFNSP